MLTSAQPMRTAGVLAPWGVAPGGGLVNAASNYGFPMTSGLIGAAPSLMGSPQSGTDWSQVALQMAGNPKAGPLAAVPVPNASMGAPGGPSTSGGGGSSALAGLLTAAAQNPGMVKNALSGLQGLLGGSSGVGTAANGSAITGNSIAGPASAASPSVASSLTDSGLVLPSDASALPAATTADIGAPLSTSTEAALGGASDAAPAVAGGAATDTSTVLAPMTGYGGSIAGANGAGELAAGAGTDAAASGGADAAGGAAAGSLGLGLLGVGAVLAPALYGMSKPAVEFGKQYYTNAGNAMSQGMRPGQPGWGILEQAAMNPGAVNNDMWLQFAQYGVTPQNIMQIYTANARSPAISQGGGQVGGLFTRPS